MQEEVGNPLHTLQPRAGDTRQRRDAHELQTLRAARARGSRSLQSHPSAIDHKRLTGYEASVVAGQERHRSGDISGRAKPLDRLLHIDPVSYTHLTLPTIYSV